MGGNEPGISKQSKHLERHSVFHRSLATSSNFEQKQRAMDERVESLDEQPHQIRPIKQLPTAIRPRSPRHDSQQIRRLLAKRPARLFKHSSTIRHQYPRNHLDRNSNMSIPTLINSILSTNDEPTMGSQQPSFF